MPLVKKSLADGQPAMDAGLPQVRARLQSANPQDRWEAARQLAVFPNAVSEISRHLAAEPDERVREALLTSLAKINSGESFDVILGYLRVDDAGLRTAALDALKLMPDVAGAKLDVLLRDPDVDVRVLACDLARATAPAIAQKSLGAVLTSEPEINVCAAAIDLLAEIGTPEILPGLVHCAARLSDPFLNFSVQMARDRINARAAQPQE